MRRRFRVAALALCCLALLQGCVSARVMDRESTRLFREAKYDEAAEHLKQGAIKQGENGRDLLLYLLDLGLALHTAGKYDESVAVFRRADKIAEIKDYTSLSKEGASLLTSENAQDYKGEDFEKVLISTYLAMDYALMGNIEDALVEARRVNQKLYMMVSQGGRNYHQSAFARYLSAVLYEAKGNWNDAYVDYRKVHDLKPDFPGLGVDLWRTARFDGMDDQCDLWDQEYHLTQEDHEKALALAPGHGKGEIIVIYQNGISPRKEPDPNWTSLPRFVPRYNPVEYAKIEINGEARGETHTLDDIEAMAIENLKEKWGGLIAKRLAGVVAKEVVADQIGRRFRNPALGQLAKFVMFASDQADLRSWNLLPKDLEIARFTVDPGTYTVRALPVGAAPTGPKTIQLKAGQKVFVTFRYMP